MDGSNVNFSKHACEVAEKSNSPVSYVNKIGDVTFIVGNSFTGTKTLTDVFEEILIFVYRQSNSDPRL